MVGKRVGVYTWDDARGRYHTLEISRTKYGVEFEEVVEDGGPTLYDSNRNYRTITIPADLDMLKNIARVLLNIVVYEKGSANRE